MSITKKEQRLRRSRQTRTRIALQGVARLSVHRSNLHIYAAIVAGDGSQVLASASTAEKEVREHPVAVDHRLFKDHTAHREAMVTFEKLYRELKDEFMHWLAKRM